MIKQLLLDQNDCYKANKYIKPKGIMVHSTGANNPNLSRYLPDDGLIGANKFGNHWNRPGVKTCVHAFIGKDKNGDVQTYQTMLWTMRAWHCGRSANDTHISFEICEDDRTDRKYFEQVKQQAIDLCVFLCKQYNLSADSIIDHSEGYKRGIASGHNDVGHWFPKHGYSMDRFRKDVKKRLMTAEEAIEHLYKVGLINNPHYWIARYREIPYLDLLLISLAVHSSKKQSEVQTLDQALDRLVEGGVINSPAYWQKNASRVNYLSDLIIKVAEYI